MLARLICHSRLCIEEKIRFFFINVIVGKVNTVADVNGNETNFEKKFCELLQRLAIAFHLAWCYLVNFLVRFVEIKINISHNVL